jgi:hypothetical protein
MNGYVRALTCVAVFGVAMTTLNRAYPEWVQQVGLDFWNLPDLQKDEQDAARRLVEIDARAVYLQEKCSGRARIVERLADGSMSLFEAASAFRAINCVAGPAVPVMFRELYPRASDEECLCRQVILWSGNHLRAKGDPKRAAELVARLEAVLEEQRRVGTPIVLPAAKTP